MGSDNRYTSRSKDKGPEPSAPIITGKSIHDGSSELSFSTLPHNKGEIILYNLDNSLEIEVLLENETVWLSLNQVAELFDRDKSVISRHVKNVFAEEELFRDRSVAVFATHLPDGRIFNVEYFNLDVIISVGYRVKSKRGTQFRQWANTVLKDHLLRGHIIHKRFERMEQRIGEAEKKIDFFIRTSMPPIYGILFEGQIFDAYVLVSDMIKSAERSVVLLDNYVDETALLMLSKRSPGVVARIYTKRITPRLQLDLEKHNAQYEHVMIHESDSFHDRFLIIDGTVYHIGASIKDLGRKMFAFSKMEVKDTVIMEGL
jgi:hypothetical protein